MKSFPSRRFWLLLVGMVLVLSGPGMEMGAGAAVRTGPADDSREALIAKLSAGSPGNTPASELTALERYVRADDGAFAWSLEKSARVEAPLAGTWHALRMTSQVWRAKGEVDIPEWTHWVCLWVPDRLVSDRPILVIGGGRRKAEPPATPPNDLVLFAGAGAIVVSVDNVPNQPLRLGDDPVERSEDGLVARTWLKAMETGDATWIARFPMVKAAVKAMDAAEQFLARHPQSQAKVGEKPLDAGFKPGAWLVAGGSKRGWTTWLTAAVDKRVGALVPLVIDVLDLPAQMKHHHAAYGFWSEALNDYVETGLTDRFTAKDGSTDPLLGALLAHEDPIFWLSRVGEKPKMLVNASGDEFFLPDSSSIYEDRLPRPWRLRYEPNTGHSLKGTSAPADLVAFYQYWAAGRAMPEVSWESRPGASAGQLLVRVRTSERAAQARLWQVETPKDRDFRIFKTGKTWSSKDLSPEGEGGLEYRGTLEAPAAGFRAAFVEVSYPPVAPGGPPLVFTTRVWVLPDVLPHASK